MNDSSVANAITDCFIELFNKKSIDKISIMEITKIVGISRVTFYNYFQNKEDILDTMLENLLAGFDELQKQNIPFLKNTNMEDITAIKNVLYPNTLEILLFFYDNQKYIHALLKASDTIDFMEILHATYYNHFLVALPEIFSVKFDEQTIVSYSMYMTTGVKAITEEWFLSNFEQEAKTVTEHILTMLAPSLAELYTRKV